MVCKKNKKPQRVRRTNYCVSCNKLRLIRAHGLCDRCYDQGRTTGLFGAVLMLRVQDNLRRAYTARTRNPWEDPKYQPEITDDDPTRPGERTKFMNTVARLIEEVDARGRQDDKDDPVLEQQLVARLNEEWEDDDDKFMNS
jgi:hypothetical protein